LATRGTRWSGPQFFRPRHKPGNGSSPA
jgi:hypothetical protein